MLIWGIAAMVVTGLTWLIWGVIMGRISRDHISADQLIFVCSGVAALVSLFIALLKLWPPVPFGTVFCTGIILFAGGLFNNRQLYFLAKAMEYGPNGIIWSITQSGFIIPFWVGVICFSVPLTGWRIAGALVLFIAIYVMGLARNNQTSSGNWRLFTFTAFAMTGITQTLNNLPSYLDRVHDVDSIWRTFFTTAGLTAGTPLAMLFSGKWKTFCNETIEAVKNKRLWFYAFTLEFFNIFGSIFLLYPGMDILVKAQAGAIAYPLMIGSCIAGFEIYSFAILHEKRNALQMGALLLCLFGVAAICC